MFAHYHGHAIPYGYSNMIQPFESHPPLGLPPLNYGFYQPIQSQTLQPLHTPSKKKRGVMYFMKYLQNAPPNKSEQQVLEQWVDFAKKAHMPFSKVRDQLPEMYHGIAARFFFGNNC